MAACARVSIAHAPGGWPVVAWACLGGLLAVLGGCAPGGGAIEQAEDRRLADAAELREALAEGDTEVRARAALAMGRIQHDSYGPSLVAASRPSAPVSVRAAALFALGQTGLGSGARASEEVLAACREAAGESDPQIVTLAVEALGKLADAGSGPTLTAALSHADAGVRAEAATALFRLRFVPVWRGEATSAPELSDDAVAALIGALTDPEPVVRRAAAHAFARHGEPRAAAALVATLADSDEWVRLFALRGLGRIADAAAATAIVRLTTDENPRLRTGAVNALASIGASDRLPPPVMFDESFHVRAAAARAWQTAEDEISVEFLRRLSQDASPTVRGAAIEALAARLGDAFVVGMDFHLKDADASVRASVARASAALPERGLEFTVKALDDEDIRVRTAALAALGGRAGVGGRIVDALGADDLALRGTAVGLVAESDIKDKVKVLSHAYKTSAGDDWIEVRESIVDAVAEIEPAAALIEKAYREDPAAAVRTRARLALEERGVDLPTARPISVTPSPWLGKRFTTDPVVVLETSKGDIEIRCHAAGAPVHVASFVHLVRDGFYDGAGWHRVVSNFVIQGGDPRGDGWGSGGVMLRDEINSRRYTRGTVGMPKSGKDTGGCQIFITHVPTPHLDGNYTVFGQVSQGLEVVDAIEVGDTIRRAYVKTGS